jgi:hypothetical protein
MKKLFLTLIFSSAMYAQPGITTLQDIAVYDKNNDGLAKFDLTSNSTALLDGLMTDEHTISYHLTFNDADFNRNPIQKPTSYTNTIQYAQELYARVTNIAEPSNYSVDLFTIRAITSKEFSEETSSKTLRPITE